MPLRRCDMRDRVALTNNDVRFPFLLLADVKAWMDRALTLEG